MAEIGLKQYTFSEQSITVFLKLLTVGIIPDKRRGGGNLTYQLLDAIKSAFVVFFFQHPSLLDFQRAMKKRNSRVEPGSYPPGAPTDPDVPN